MFYAQFLKTNRYKLFKEIEVDYITLRDFESNILMVYSRSLLFTGPQNYWYLFTGYFLVCAQPEDYFLNIIVQYKVCFTHKHIFVWSSTIRYQLLQCLSLRIIMFMKTRHKPYIICKGLCGSRNLLYTTRMLLLKSLRVIQSIRTSSKLVYMDLS